MNAFINDFVFLDRRNLEGNQLSGTIPMQLIVNSENGLLEFMYVVFQKFSFRLCPASVLTSFPMSYSFISSFFTTMCGMG